MPPAPRSARRRSSTAAKGIAPRGRRTPRCRRGPGLDQATDLDHVLLMRNDLPIHPRAQYVVDPVALGLIDQIEHQSRFLVALGNLIQEVLVVHLPAKVLAHQAGYGRAGRSGLAGNRDITLPPGRRSARLLTTAARRPSLAAFPRYASSVRRRLRSAYPDELDCSCHPPGKREEKQGEQTPLQSNSSDPKRAKRKLPARIDRSNSQPLYCMAFSY